MIHPGAATSFTGVQRDGRESYVATIRSYVAMVRRLFPDRSSAVARLAVRDDEFRSMCADYGMAVETLDLLERRNHPMDVERMIEYRALIKELERDLKGELLASAGNATDWG